MCFTINRCVIMYLADTGEQWQLDESVCGEGVCQNGATCVEGRGSAFQCMYVSFFCNDCSQVEYINLLMFKCYIHGM